MTPDLIEHQKLLELNLTAADVVVETMMRMGDNVLFVGRAGEGKSVWAQQLALSVAGGYSFVGHLVPKKRIVLYIAAEGDLVELQERGKAMSRLLPIDENTLYYWSMPEHLIDSASGRQDVLNACSYIQSVCQIPPSLIIYDPAQYLMSGAMTEDKDVRRFTRNVDLIKKALWSEALPNGPVSVIIHHTHRPIRNSMGEEIDEKGMDYLGSQSWIAWAKYVFVLKPSRTGNRTVLSVKQRKPLGYEPTEIVMVEPDPLLYVPAREGYTAAMESILLSLKVFGPMTQDKIRHLTKKKTAYVVDALETLEGKGLIKTDSSWPKNYALKEL